MKETEQLELANKMVAAFKYFERFGEPKKKKRKNKREREREVRKKK